MVWFAPWLLRIQIMEGTIFEGELDPRVTTTEEERASCTADARVVELRSRPRRHQRFL